MTPREAEEALKSRHSRLQELSQSQQPGGAKWLRGMIDSAKPEKLNGATVKTDS